MGAEMKVKDYVQAYLSDVGKVARLLDIKAIRKAIAILMQTKKKKGRLFILGVGGGAANASHAVNDFRKIGGIEAYSPLDNVAELTSRVNDDGWDTVFVNWLKVSKLNKKDCVFVFSVGGGDKEKNISANLVFALEYAKTLGVKIIGIVGRDGGYTAKLADAAVIIPTVKEITVTPLTESFQAVIWHLFVSHPAIKSSEMKWESVEVK
jgi:D-sedoheptulose 7-phosphate isomerase